MPWSHALISGLILDPDRKKMSKSKGNVVVPTEILEQVRRRRGPLAGRDGPAGPGLAVRRDPDEGRPPAGDEGAQRLQVRPRRRRRHRAQRLRGLRAGRLRAARPAGRRSSPQATEAFEAYDYTTALEVTERFFWEFCDDYLELVKERAYGARGGRSEPPRPRPAPPWRIALQVQLRLLAPFLPYVTEEVWSWWQEGSIHRARLADRGRPRRRGRRRPGDARRRRRRADRDPRRQVAGQGLDAPRADQGPHLRPRGRWSEPPSSPPTTCARPARSPAS